MRQITLLIPIVGGLGLTAFLLCTTSTVHGAPSLGMGINQEIEAAPEPPAIPIPEAPPQPSQRPIATLIRQPETHPKPNRILVGPTRLQIAGHGPIADRTTPLPIRMPAPSIRVSERTEEILVLSMVERAEEDATATEPEMVIQSPVVPPPANQPAISVERLPLITEERNGDTLDESTPLLIAPPRSSLSDLPSPLTGLPSLESLNRLMESDPEDEKSTEEKESKASEDQKRTSETDSDRDLQNESSRRQGLLSGMVRRLGERFEGDGRVGLFRNGSTTSRTEAPVISPADPADPIAVANMKKAIGRHVLASQKHRIEALEVLVNDRRIHLRARAAFLWQRPALRRALEAVPVPPGYRTTVEVR